jgi:periplasmic protein TonB
VTKRIDPLSAEALAIPLPAEFLAQLHGSTITEAMAEAHPGAPAAGLRGEPADPVLAAIGPSSRPGRKLALWTGMLLVSVALHASFSFLFLKPPEITQIAGGAPSTVAVIGNAFEDMQLAGEETSEPETVEPVEPDMSTETAQRPESEAPVETAPTEPVETSETVAPAAPDSVVVTEAPVTRPQEVADETTPPDAPAESLPVETTQQRPETSAEPIVRQEPEAAQSPVETTEAIEPLPDPIEDVPVPTPRPAYTPPPPRAEPQREVAEPQRPRQTQGSQGNQQANQQRGTAQGQATSGAPSQAAAPSAASQAAGNAAVSNYPGQVVTRLRRALRYPAEARRARVTGEVHVSFTVSANGAVGGISVVRSSGSPILDQAAIQTVQSAAPFPAIPPAAGRSSWPFTVPLAFTR